jgi:hypothetical protein
MSSSEPVLAERLVMAEIKARYPERYYVGIPNFNDDDGVSYDDVMAVVDGAIARVAPPSTRAEDIMSEEERDEIHRASILAQIDIDPERFDELLAEYAERGWDAGKVPA